MKELTQEKNHMNVNTVARPLVVLVTFRSMKEPTLERSPMSVRSAAKPSFIPQVFRDT
jgi:hypothetical protein